MATINVSGGSLTISGGNLSVINGGGGGGGGGSIDPSTRSDLKLRFVAGDYSTLQGSTWNPTGGNSQHVQIYYASGWNLGANNRNDGNVPRFNGQGSAYVSDMVANNYNGMWFSPYLDVPGGSTARTLYIVAYVPDVTAGTNPTHLFVYGTAGWQQDTVGFTLDNGYIYGQSSYIAAGPGGAPYGTPRASTKGKAIQSATPFVASFAYAAGSDLSSSDLFVNGSAGGYGSGVSGVIQSANDGSGVMGSADWIVALDTRLYGESGGGAPFYVADILVFNTAHDSTTRQAVEAWLMTQYGISA